MKESKFTDAQKVFIIKQGEDGMTVAEIYQSGNLSQLEEEVPRRMSERPLVHGP